jgi:hypothetical protein
MDWAKAKNILGNALTGLGKLTRDKATLRRAEAAYREALKVCTRERAPTEWAAIQNNLGNLLERRHELSCDAATLQRAKAAYLEALDAYAATGKQDFRQRVAGKLSSLLASTGEFSEAATIIEPAIALSNAAVIDASRSAEARARAVEVVNDLYGLLSLCRLRGSQHEANAALMAAEAGRARLLANVMDLDAVRLEEINDTEIRERIKNASGRQQALRRRLGFESSDGRSPLEPLSASKRPQLLEELAEASETYLSLYREYGLVRTPEPPTLAGIRAAAPSGGTLVLPVLTERGAFVFIVTEAGSPPAVIDLPRLSHREVLGHLSGNDRWFNSYYRHFREHVGEDLDAVEQWQVQLSVTMAWLWERLLAPVHSHLPDVAKLERDAPVVLLPPGLLGMLPLHAAGPGSDGRMFGDH